MTAPSRSSPKNAACNFLSASPQNQLLLSASSIGAAQRSRSSDNANPSWMQTVVASGLPLWSGRVLSPAPPKHTGVASKNATARRSSPIRSAGTPSRTLRSHGPAGSETCANRQIVDPPVSK
jgi:hypothetical protein